MIAHLPVLGVGDNGHQISLLAVAGRLGNELCPARGLTVLFPRRIRVGVRYVQSWFIIGETIGLGMALKGLGRDTKHFTLVGFSESSFKFPSVAFIKNCIIEDRINN